MTPGGVKEERDSRSICLGDYSFIDKEIKYITLNSISPNLFPINNMQYGSNLDRILWIIVFSVPTLGPIKLPKVDPRNRFYHIVMRPAYATNIGLTFPGTDNVEKLVYTPLVPPTVWKNSLIAFYDAK